MNRLVVGSRVAVGLVATGLFAALSLVFFAAAAGNSGHSQRFQTVILPLAIAAFAVQVVASVLLYMAKKDKVAQVVAWAPIALLVGLVALGQSVREIAAWFS